MKQTYQFITLVVATLLFACGNKETEKSSIQVPVQQVVAQLFSPPSDGLVTSEKAKTYAEASAAILLLSQQWVERMENASEAQEKILILSGFEKARDEVCRKIGLSGIQEYNWISDVASKNPANKAVLEKAGIRLGIK